MGAGVLPEGQDRASWWQAVPVVVSEAQLRTGMGVLRTADRLRVRRLSVQVDPAGQLAHLRAVVRQAIGIDRGRPGWLGLGRDRFGTWASICIEARTPRHARAGARPAGCSPRRCRYGPGLAGHQRSLGAAPAPNRPRRSDHRQHRARRCLVRAAGRPAARPGLARVQVGQQSAEPERLLVGAGGGLFGVAAGKATPHDNVEVHGGWESRSEAIV